MLKVDPCRGCGTTFGLHEGKCPVCWKGERDELVTALKWALEECVAADKERQDGGPDVRSLTQPLRGGLRAALPKVKEGT